MKSLPPPSREGAGGERKPRLLSCYGKGDGKKGKEREALIRESPFSVFPGGKL